MISRRLTPFCKFSIFWVLIALSENFTVTAPNGRSDDKHHKKSFYLEACDSILKIGLFLNSNGVKYKSPHNCFKMSSVDKQFKTSWKRWWEASDSILEAGHFWGS